MSGSFPILDLIILGGGVYLLWAAVGMKANNKIPGMLLSKGMDLTKAKDIKGFTRAMFVPTLVMGMVAALSGIIGAAGSYIVNLATLQFIVLIISFLLLIGYGYLTVRCQKKYLGL